METRARTVYRFGPFEVDTAAGELLKQGKRMSLQEQPFRLLVILLEHSGEVVTRAQIESRIWERHRFIDLDSSLRVAVGKLRTALGDDAANPRYIETIPKRGYRFLAPTTVQPVTDSPDFRQPAVLTDATATAVGPSVPELHAEPLPRRTGRLSKWPLAGAIVLLAAIAASTLQYLSRDNRALTGKDTIVLADFSNTTGDPVFDETLRQGMRVELEQSPFLSLVPDERIQQTLRFMGRPSDAHLIPEIALEICERTASAAVLSGSISSLGNQYILGLRAKDCRTGNVIDEQQVQVAKKEDLLGALTGMAGKFRSRAGESLATVHEHDKPLEEATTSSLEALKAFSMGLKVQDASGSSSAIPFFQHAIEMDPKFALAHAVLGRLYGDIGELDLSADSTTKAFELRDRASDQERFFIDAHYAIAVTGNLDRAEHTCKTWMETYPREKASHAFRAGLIYPTTGKFAAAIEESKTAISLDPDFPIGYAILASTYISLNRLVEAQNALQWAAQRGLNIPDFSALRYDLAFLKGDRTQMQHQAALAENGSDANDWILGREALTLAYYGRLVRARAMTDRAVQWALGADQRETAAQLEAGAAVREALFGERRTARQSAEAALAQSRGRVVQYGAALAFALAGDNSRAAAMTNDLEKRFPQDTSVRFSYVPVLRARLALNEGEPSRAIEALRAAIPNELGAPTSSALGFGALLPIYVRGNVYLDAHQGKQAAAEYQKILDHRGITLSDPIGVLAHLQLGRAYALAADKDKACAAYNDFLTLWKDADPNIPILKEARMEYANLRKWKTLLHHAGGPHRV